MLTRLKKLLNLSRPPVADHGSDSFSMLLENSEDLVLRLNGGIYFTYVSPASRHIFGLEPEEMMGHALRDYAIAEDREALIANGTRLLGGQTDTDTSSFRIIRKDGALRWVEVNSKAELDRAGRRTGEFVIVLRDVTEQKELEAKLAVLTKTDGLTGLANRRLFDETLERCWRGAQRTKNHLSMLFLDLDQFKTFNDTYGHQAGDDCLRQTARAVSSAILRPEDLVARYGGEEMAVILPDTDGTGAVDVAVRALDAVRALKIPHAHNAAGAGFVSTSIGVATAIPFGAETAGSPGALVEAADCALYAAKSQGRNGLAVAPPVMMAASPPA